MRSNALSATNRDFHDPACDCEWCWMGVTSTLPLPKVGEMCDYLRGGYGDFVRQMPKSEIAEPEEIWLPALSCWLRADATTASFDIQRGFQRVWFNPLERWRLRRAIARFRHLVAATDRLAEAHGLLPKASEIPA